MDGCRPKPSCQAVTPPERKQRHEPGDAPASHAPALRVGVDTGGTFTDIFAVDESGQHLRWKVLSTPDDPARAILQGLSALFPGMDPSTIEMVHGTTVGTNAFLERKGARTVLLATLGLEDVLWIGRQARPRLFDLLASRPPGIVSRRNVLGLKERISWQGKELVGLSPAEISRAKAFCKERNAESVAVCLLHSYANPAHEKALAGALRSDGFLVSASHEVLPEFREFERTSTTVINAYLGPVVGNYVERLRASLPGARLFIQQSNGGCGLAAGVGHRAVHTLLSGPAGGVQAAWKLGQALGMKNLITLDMGGTSTDVSLCPGKLTYTRDYKIQGFPVAIPILDIHTVGAGGGSIAWVDSGGMLRVGPKSAGADPGPACYGRGDRITVTDANLFLQRLHPRFFLAGRMDLYPERVGPRMAELGKKVGLSPVETALGIVRLVNTNMVQALRAVSLERGYDPRDFVLVCFGGAAGLHAAELAEELEMERVLFPAMAGVFSARGMAESDLVFHRSNAFILRRAQECRSELRDAMARLCASVREEVARQGLDADALRLEAFLDARYQGQSFELTVPWNEDWVDCFSAEHQRLYGYRLDGRDLETTALRIRATLARGMPVEDAGWKVDGHERPLGIRQVPVCFDSGVKDSLVIYRKELEREERSVRGPALILDDFTTMLVPPGWRTRSLGAHILLERAGDR